MSPESIGIFFLGMIAGIIVVFGQIKYHEWMENREICSECGKYK